MAVQKRKNSPTGDQNQRDSVPEELKRQSTRAESQLRGLTIILEDSKVNLDNLATIFKTVAGESHELPATITQLSNSIEEFNRKVNTVYSQIGSNLASYATRMENSFAELQASVEEIKSQIDALNPSIVRN